MKQILMALTLALVLLPPALLPMSAQAIEAKADYALLMDVQSGVTLYEKNADAPMTPASMSKLMTVLVVFEALKNGEVSLDDEFVVSDDAWRRGGAASGGSTMFLEARSRVSVGDLLSGVIIQSGNDACIVLAEGIGGSETAFADIMNDMAEVLGFTNSFFVNSTGLPHPDHKMSARDLAKLAHIIITQYSDYYSLFSEREFTWNNIRQENRNPLLYANIGADGLKTGHTLESGYGLVASGEQNGRRLILVMNGLNSKRQRAAQARRFMNWGFRAFAQTTLLERGQVVRTLPVWHGAEAGVEIVPEKRFEVLAPRGARRKMIITITYERPIIAPIEKGDAVALMRVTIPGLAPQEMSMLAAQKVERGNFIGRSFDSLGYMLWGGAHE
ncbi:MAG: D-alanyl-D-alanine carboxypeptidase [Alphaproteobacteria bacterium]|nr:D-alanyl-D-alanine carboxypeptidase [Alphaproteobacteria bacterium]MBE8220096.1 D-alanyl-D-alanine carboxypeptidase [Alphaproteobacteria bacterium]